MTQNLPPTQPHQYGDAIHTDPGVSSRELKTMLNAQADELHALRQELDALKAKLAP